VTAGCLGRGSFGFATPSVPGLQERGEGYLGEGHSALSKAEISAGV
jgi:hypothetical protein